MFAVFHKMTLSIKKIIVEVKTMKWLIVIIVLTALIFPAYVTAEQTTALELLEKYAAGRKAMDKHIIESKEIVEVINTAEETVHKISVYEYKFIKDGEKISFKGARQTGKRYK